MPVISYLLIIGNFRNHLINEYVNMPVHVCHIVLIRYTAGETADLHILVFTQNGEKNGKHPVCGSSVRGRVRAHTKVTVTQRSTLWAVVHRKACPIAQHVETVRRTSYDRRSPHQVLLLSARNLRLTQSGQNRTQRHTVQILATTQSVK